MSLQIRESLQQFFVLGVSYKKTSLSVREQFSIHIDQQEEMLNDARTLDVEGFMILSTCNRTEIFCYTENIVVIKRLFLSYCIGDAIDFERFSYTLNGREAVKHIFHVSSGLDSQIIGDFQIVGQVKNAYQQSEAKGLINSFMNRLFNYAFQASKKVKNETELSRGAASVSHASVQYIKDHIEDLENTSFLLYGTGKIGQDTCSNLLKHMSNRSIVLLNRTESKAISLAQQLSVSSDKVDNLNNVLDKSQVIIIATGASSPTLTLEHFDNKNSEKLVLDLSVPRNVSKDIDNLPNVRVFTVDDLSAYVKHNMDNRIDALPIAKEIIEEIIEEFYGWLHMKYLSPVIVALKDNLRKIQDKELDYHRSKLSDVEMEKVEHITTNIVNKIARACITHLKDRHKKESSPMETLDFLFQDINK